MELFLSPCVEFEKNAAEVTLPEDPNQWPQEILQELYKQVPYISDFEPKIVMDRVDGERAFGFGHVDVQNKTEAPSASTPDELDAAGIRSARIPIVIKEGKLQPLDLIVTADSKMLPLTEKRLRQAIFRPQLFDITSKTPGDLSMIGQLYPPHRSNFGYGGAGVAFGAEGLGKTGAVKEALDLSTIGSYLKKQKDPQGLARASRSLLGRGTQQVTSGAPELGRKTLLAGNIAAQRAGQFASPMALAKAAADLTGEARKEIKPSNFAIPAKKSDTGEGKYPINDVAHARNALVRVRQFGTDAEKAKVYAAIVKKYPALATRSEVIPEEKQRSAEKRLGLPPGGESQRHEAPKQKVGSILSAILPTINEEDYAKFAARFADDGLRAAYRLNHSATFPAIQKLAAYEGWSARSIAEGIVNDLRPSVAQVTKVAGGYSVKTASHNLWLPKEQIVDRGQLVKLAGVKVALDADLNGSVTIAQGANVDRDLPDAEHPEQIKDFGLWKVQTTEGDELVGYVFPTLMDLDGQTVPVALFTNGSQAALQADMAGVRVGEGASLFEGRPFGRGIFFKVLKSGRAVGTVPMTVRAAMDAGGSGYLAETFDGQALRLVRQPGVEIPTRVDGETALVPADWNWLPLDNAKSVVLVEQVADMGKQAEARAQACGVTIRSGGPESFSFSGMVLDKLGNDRTQFLSYDDAVFLLAGLGVAPTYAQQKLAEACVWPEPIFCRVGREIETAESNALAAGEKTAEVFSNYKNLRRDLVKEAAFVPDPGSVDTILSLGFINPENIRIFVSSLPAIDAAQQKMCELLLAARLGLSDVPAYALERAIKAAEEVFEGLRTLAFAKN